MTMTTITIRKMTLTTMTMTTITIRTVTMAIKARTTVDNSKGRTRTQP